MTGTPAAGDLVFIGDVHLDRDDPDLPAFLDLLDHVGASASRVVLMGDLFNLWLGRAVPELPHQRAVIERLTALRHRGIQVRYLEGNRDYRIGPSYAGTALDEVSDGGFVETAGGRRIFAIHGDLANPTDRRYRTWRRVSRSAPVWALFRLLPPRRRLVLAERLERKLRETNLDYKRTFPEEEVRCYAAGFLRAGHDTVVLGHFHLERDLQTAPPAPPGRILVLPCWKDTRRHLRVTPAGDLRFESCPS
jgi:UDP-2,3-diacylglucosamine hydrolase